MLKRSHPQPLSNRAAVKLVTCHNGEYQHYLEPSVVCAAQHAINVCDNEEGCAQSIEVDGQVVWKFNPERPRQSLELLDELAQGQCAK